jgi:nucleoside-triphosphatase THEP1
MELIKHTPLNETWLKAAVIGSLWASVEIVAGSFLHNLQIPFSGTILTAFAIFLLSAFSVLWKERGIVWRAGVICALMKSISPSAVIIGPMVGIFTEAILFEMMLFLLGRTIPGYLMGGAIAALSAIIHKFLALLILYGFDFVRILDALYHYAVRQLNMPTIQPIVLLWMLTGLYLLIGVVASATGIAAGSGFKKNGASEGTPHPVKIRNENQLFGMSEKQNYSVPLILVHILVITIVLLLFNQNYTLYGGFLAGIYLAFCVYRYPNSLRRLKKVSVWFQFILIVVTAILIWDVFNSQVTGYGNGWLIGLKMIFRAILLIIGFAAISVELKNPLVKAVLYKKGLSSLYQSLSLTFGVLPDLVESLASSRRNLLNPVSLSNHLLLTAQNLIQIFQDEQRALPVIFILTGEVETGKTTVARKLIDALSFKGFQVKGFLSEAVYTGEIRSGFKLVNIGNGESVLSCQTDPKMGWSKTGRYYFNPEVFTFGDRVLDPEGLKDAQLIVIDELGPLEMNNMGWSPAVGKLCASILTPQLWIIRKSLVHKLARKWSVGDIYIFDVGTDSISDMEEAIRLRLNNN